MKTRRNLLYALFLALFVSVLVGVPTQASAATVAKIGSTKYSSLEAAVKKVKNGQTITLQKSVTYSEKRDDSSEGSGGG